MLTDEQIKDEASHHGFIGSTEMLVKFARAIESEVRASHGQAPARATEQQILEAAFAPAQPAAEASRFGSPELQAMIIARCVAKYQADSVTAPAGGALRAQVETLTRDCGRQASKIAELIADLKSQEGRHREDRARLQALYEHQRGECWYWQGDGQDHLESLCNTLPVVIRAGQLRAMLSTPHAQTADSVQEDAARYRWLADYLVGDLTDLDDEIVACKSVYDLSKVVDAARKQGGQEP